MESRLSLVLRNELAELERLFAAVTAWCQQNSIPSEMEYPVNLALDEIVSNVIRHGWKDGGEHQIQVQVYRRGDEVCAEVEDDGLPFNPLEAPAPDVTRPLEERPVGGLGIHLVRHIMDGLEYRRHGGKNLLIMKKNIGRG
jgi:serine/threonine-protein kinase RsbW